MMNDNKHYKAEKVNGFWDFVYRDPPENYQAKHNHGPGKPSVEMIQESLSGRS